MLRKKLIDRSLLKDFIKEQKIKTMEDATAFAKGILSEIINLLLQEELKEDLGYDKYNYAFKQTDNSRNGYYPKYVDSNIGTLELEMPRDRKSEFEPQVVKKGQKDIIGLEEKIISLYASNMSTRDIQKQIKEIYGIDISPEFVSNATDAVLEKARSFQARPLEEIYTIIFLDATFFKERRDGQSKPIALYNVIGIDLYGKKDCLGLYMCETESAKYWLSVLNDLKNRGVKDILIATVDGLSGFKEAIRAAIRDTKVHSAPSKKLPKVCVV
jgi:transposase-like protein